MTWMGQMDQDVAIAFCDCRPVGAGSARRGRIAFKSGSAKWISRQVHTDEGLKFVFIRVHSWLEHYDQ
jgi:hypothetical protein